MASHIGQFLDALIDAIREVADSDGDTDRYLVNDVERLPLEGSFVAHDAETGRRYRVTVEAL